MGIEIIWTELKIRNFNIKHEELTSILGINPTKAFNKGDLLVGSKNKMEHIAKFNLWVLTQDFKFDTEGDYTKMIEVQIDNILEKIRPVKDKFLEVTKDCDAWIEMIIEFYEWHSYLEFSRKISKQLVEFNLYIHFDLHYMSDDEIEEEKES